MKFLLVFILTIKLFGNCAGDMVLFNSGTKNAIDYVQKANHKYALIEISEAITYGEQALGSCEGKVSKSKMQQLSKDIHALKVMKKKILLK